MAEPASRLVLASGSPRRRAIMGALGLPFESVDLDVDETTLPDERPMRLTLRLALAKAAEGAQRYPEAIVVGADTVVVLGRRAFGKPATPAEAADMLRQLRGRSHLVVTAVAAARHAPKNGATGTTMARGRHPPPQPSPASGEGVRTWSHVAVTRVRMRDYGESEIERSVTSAEPFDKAGAYAIQDAEFHPVARIEGCFLTVVGLPLPETCQVLAEAGGPAPRITPERLASVCPACSDVNVLRPWLSS